MTAGLCVSCIISRENNIIASKIQLTMYNLIDRSCNLHATCFDVYRFISNLSVYF